MDNFLKMDIFFFVATCATVLIAILMTLVLLRVLRILKKIDDVTALVRDEGEQLRQDIASVRNTVHEGGVRLGHVLGFLRRPSKRTRTKQS